jgi:peptidyl-prolyl cis-trans isomerase SurA
MKNLIMLLSTIIVLGNTLMAHTKFDDLVLATVGNEKITYSELERAFQKNLNRKHTKLSEIPEDSLKSFLNMFIEYKLKVIDSKRRGYDKKPEVIAEMQRNKDMLANSYYFDEMLYKPFLDRAMERRKSERKVAYIMISFSQFGDTDSLTALKKANEVLFKLKAGEKFEDLAAEYSEDEVTSKKGGVIDRWLTSGTIARKLENPIFSTEKGKYYPKPIASRKSFFIVKVIDIAPRFLIRSSHILLGRQRKENIDSLADYIKAELKKDPSKFVEFVKKYSDDANTVKHNGSLVDFYSRSTGLERNNNPLMTQYENAVFNLKEGDISEKFRTPFGIHIARCDSIKQIDVEKEREDLRNMYRRLYFYKDKDLFLDSLVYLHKYKTNKEVLTKLLSLIDTTKTNLQSDWDRKLDDKILSQTLYSIEGKNYTLKEFIEVLKTKNEFKGYATNRFGFMQAIRKLVHPIAFELETKDYEKRNKGFAAMLKEFDDATLLYKVESDVVWNKLKFDTTEAKSYYEKHKNEFKTDLSYEIGEIYVFNDSLANAIYDAVANKGESFEKLAAQKTQRAGKRKIGGDMGIVSGKTNKFGKLVAERDPKPGKLLKPIKLEKGGYSIIRVKNIVPIRTKTFDEAIPDFAATLQETKQKRLTKEWLSGIKETTKININQKSINKIYK